MRLLESQRYRGKQIRVYVIYPDGPSKAPTPSLGVRVDGQVLENKAFLQGIYQLPDALNWGHEAVDRLLGREGREDRQETMLLPAPV